MSSFRPDPPLRDLAFRPTASSAGRSAAFEHAAEAAARPPRRAVEAKPACTPEQHAALERAAFEKGLESAQADAARCEAACAVLEEASAAMSRASVGLLHASREAMLELAAEIARRWIGEELRLDPSRFAGPLERALADCEGAVAARLHLHPDVLAALDTSLPGFTERWSERLELELRADANLAASGFRIETDTLAVEAGLETLAPRLREALAAAFEAAPGEAAAC